MPPKDVRQREADKGVQVKVGAFSFFGERKGAGKNANN